jgi:hypothetical protein
VPSIDTDDTEPPGGGDEPLVFERSDFEELLNPGDGAAVQAEKKPGLLTSNDDPVAIPSASEPPAGAWGTHAEPALKVQHLAVTARPAGILLSPTMVKILVGAAIVALALAFGVGWLIGHWTRPAETQPTARVGSGLETGSSHG